MTPPEPAPLPASVLVCTRGRPEMLWDTVASVLAGNRVPREVVVVDQSDDAHPRLPGLGVVRGCEVRYLRSAERGLSRGRNTALRAAREAVVVLVDDDMFAEPDWLEHLLGGVQDDPLSVVTGRVLAAPPEATARPIPPAALVTTETPEVFRGRQLRDVVPGANVALHRRTVLDLGGYDERLGAGTRFAAADDNDMGLRLLEAGCVVRHEPAAVLLHRAWRTERQLRRMRWDYGRGKGAFYAKHLRRSDPYAARRLAADVARHLRRAVTTLPGDPAAAAGHVQSLAGLLSGTLGWLVRERRAGS